MNFKSLLLVFIFFSNTIWAISPKYTIKTNGNVTDLHYEAKHLYVSTDNGSIQVFNIPSKHLLKTYYFPKIKDFTDESITPKIFSFDKIRGKDILAAVSQGLHGFSNVFLIKNGKYIRIIRDTENKLMIKKIRFISENEVIIGLLSNEIILFDILNNREIYRRQISPYTFSDVVLNKEKTKLITADESGIIHIIDVKSGKTLQNLSGSNVDNVYKIDYKGDIIVCGGQDRRLSVYNLSTHKSYYINSSFLIYCVGLSPSGNYAAYSCDENNDIQIMNTKTKAKISVLKGHKSTLTKILFTAENKLFTGAEEKLVYFWEI
ncbi:MAG: hypothetical protein GXO80_09050 [Chlorobi bacterium]|nr:hypothetical protein [Chlorobiota bacterium]